MSTMSTWDPWEDDWPIEPETQTQTQTHAIDIASADDEFTKNTLDSDDRKFIEEALQNVILSDTQIHKSDINHDVEGCSYEYPLRPYAEDCAFYMKTGTCKFQSTCKFNHPFQRAYQGMKEKEGFVDEPLNITCKFYVMAGGCKFGDACKYKHSLEASDLNFLGLPLRPGEKECSFYMRNGSCAYGAKCKFHHPDPTDLGSSDAEKEAQVDSLGKSSGSWEDRADEPNPLPASVESEPTAEPWAPHMIMKENTFYLENHSCRFPEAVDSSKEQLSREWNVHQTPTEETLETTLNTQANGSREKNDGPRFYLPRVWIEEFPERPGQIECDYYMKTGDCKFRSACKFHHPKNRFSRLDTAPLRNRDVNQKSYYELENVWENYQASEGDSLSDRSSPSIYQQQGEFEEFPQRPGRPECNYFMKTGDCKYRYACSYHHPKDRHSTACSLNDKGLPLRPDSEVCDHFRRYRICKFGRRCLFDHPEGLGLLNSSGVSSPNISSGTGSDSATLEGSKLSDCENGSEIIVL